MKLYRRENYLSKIRGFYHDTGMIKVISGVRRCGKSSLMHIIADELEESGVESGNIVFIDLKRREYRDVDTPQKLEAVIDRLLSGKNGVKYLFIDEIQNVEGFEEVIEEYRLEEEYSIFITGSNSYMLSGELMTVLTGRYVGFEMFTLTFEEYLLMKEFYKIPLKSSITEELDEYILEGGFPKALFYENIEDKRRYVKSVIDEIYARDIKKRVKIRNLEAFNKVKTYIINNFGSPTSIPNILEELRKDGLIIKRETLQRYMEILIEAKIIYRCRRFDLKTKKSIHGEDKYYLADLSFYFADNVDNRINYGPVLENVVYQYALSKGYEASIGRVGRFECDFILRKSPREYSYVQVAMTIQNSTETENREYAPLEMIRDNYPKYVMTRNDMIQYRSGIIHVNIGPFMKAGRLF